MAFLRLPLLIFLFLVSQSGHSATLPNTYLKFFCKIAVSDFYWARLFDVRHLDSALISIDELFYKAQTGGRAATPMLDQYYPAGLRQQLEQHVSDISNTLKEEDYFYVDTRDYLRFIRKFESDQLDDLILLHPEILEQALSISRRSLLLGYQEYADQVKRGQLVTNKDVLKNLLASAFFHDPAAVIGTIKKSYANTYLPKKEAAGIGYRHTKEEVAQFLTSAFDTYLLSVEERLSHVQVGVFLPTDQALSVDAHALTFGLPIQWLPIFNTEKDLHGSTASSGVATLVYVEQSIEAMQRMAYTIEKTKKNNATWVFNNYLAVQGILSTAQQNVRTYRKRRLALGVFLLSHEQWMWLGGDVDPVLTVAGLKKMWQEISKRRYSESGAIDPLSSFARMLGLLNADSREWGRGKDTKPYTEAELGRMLGVLIASSQGTE